MGVFGEVAKKRKQKQRHLNRNWMALVGILAVFIGIALIYLSSHLPDQLPQEYSDMISTTIMPLGQVIISISITALLFERFGYVDYTVNRVCDALARDEVLNVLSPGRKEELKELLFEDIYLGHQPAQDPSQLIRQLDQDIGVLLADYYYEEYHTSCDISCVVAKNGQQFFRKHISRIMTIQPIQLDQKCQLDRLFRLHTNAIPADTTDQEGNVLVPLQFIELSINDVPLQQGAEYELVEEKCVDNATYAIGYTLKVKNPSLLELTDKPLRIKMVYTTCVSCTDPIYSITVDKPCKFFSCHFSNAIPDYNLHVKSYGFMSFGNNNRKMHLQTQSGVTVRFRSWILPGDGAAAMLTPRQALPMGSVYTPSIASTACGVERWDAQAAPKPSSEVAEPVEVS